MSIRNNKFPSGDALGSPRLGVRQLQYRVEMQVNGDTERYEAVTGTYLQTYGAIPYPFGPNSLYLIGDPSFFPFIPNGDDSLVFHSTNHSGPITALLSYSYYPPEEGDLIDVVDTPVPILAGETASSSHSIPSASEVVSFSVTFRAPDAP